MNYKKLYEKQFREKKLVDVPQRRFWGLRKLLGKYDWHRYTATEQLIDQGTRILDIGCGDGHLLRKLESKFEELYGLDVAPSLIKKAEQKTKEFFPTKASKFSFIEGNADERLPFPNDYFNVITSIAVIEHVYDIFFFIQEIHRTLKSGAYVIAQVPNIAYLNHRVSFLLGKLPVTSSPYNWEEIGWDGGHIHYFTMEKFCWLFESQGFKIEKRTGSGFLAPFRNWHPALLCGDLIIKAVKR